MSTLCPVILSGGSGTRLWPLSRELHPKQVIPFDGDTLFGKTLERVAALEDVQDPIVVCNEQHRFFASGMARLQPLHAAGERSRRPPGFH